MPRRGEALVVVVALWAAGCGGDEPEPRYAVAVRDGIVDSASTDPDALHIVMADGPLDCANPFIEFVGQTGCELPTWVLRFRVPSASLDSSIDVKDSPGLSTVFSLSGCQTGEPEIDAGTLRVDTSAPDAVAVELRIIARSSFDPSGDYSATRCP